jgi:glycosyltransferase involved in cell wall biosynthesis
MKKYKILTFVAYYLPGYKSGGPVRTIANMVESLSSDFHFKIITSDRDSFETDSYPDIQVNAWNRVGQADVFYVSPHKRTLGYLRQILQDTEYDVLYLNSLFATHFTIKPLMLRRLGLIPDKPVVIAPRGEFSQGAMGLKSRKKHIYLSLANTLSLYNNMTWQASSEHEVNDIKREMGKRIQKISIAPNLPSAVPELPVMQQPADTDSDRPLKIIFLSRISPKKNLDYAIAVLAQVKARVQFDLYGIVDDLGLLATVPGSDQRTS